MWGLFKNIIYGRENTEKQKFQVFDDVERVIAHYSKNIIF